MKEREKERKKKQLNNRTTVQRDKGESEGIIRYGAVALLEGAKRQHLALSGLEAWLNLACILAQSSQSLSHAHGLTLAKLRGDA